MRRFLRVFGGTSVLALVLSLTTLVSPAAAEHVQCGDVITESVTLDSDVGPCPGDGLVVVADNVTVDLNGFRVFGLNGPEEQVGIRLVDVSGVTVQNGTVTDFDAGVAIEGGSGNTVRTLLVRDNINDLIGECTYGDGITVFDSDDNVIERNEVVHNGPYSGISLVGDSDRNVVRNNVVADNNVPNIREDGTRGPCGEPFSRPIQDIGIRIEGPGANDNRIQGNTVTNSAIVGISIHGHVCNPPEGSPFPVQDPNTGNLILNNTVTDTGRETHMDDPMADGIGILRQGPLTVVCSAYDNTIRANQSTGNFRDGINLGATTTDNVIQANRVDGNARDGIHLAGPPMREGQLVINPETGEPFPGAVNNVLMGNRGFGNDRFDGADFNPDCDANQWRGNLFGTVNQPCVGSPNPKAAGGNPNRG